MINPAGERMPVHRSDEVFSIDFFVNRIRMEEKSSNITGIRNNIPGKSREIPNPENPKTLGVNGRPLNPIKAVKPNTFEKRVTGYSRNRIAPRVTIEVDKARPAEE